MGMIMIIAGCALIAAAVVLALFYRSKPLEYVPPEVKGIADTGTSYATQRTMMSTVKSESVLQEEQTETMAMTEAMLQPEDLEPTVDEEGTVPMFGAGGK